MEQLLPITKHGEDLQVKKNNQKVGCVQQFGYQSHTLTVDPLLLGFQPAREK